MLPRNVWFATLGPVRRGTIVFCPRYGVTRIIAGDGTDRIDDDGNAHLGTRLRGLRGGPCFSLGSCRARCG